MVAATNPKENIMKNRNYMAIGMDELGQIYGVPVNEDGSLALNPTGGKTSCNVIVR